MSQLKTIKIDNVEYVRADSQNVPAEKLDGLTYGIFRTYSAGVFAGYKKEMNGKEAKVIQSRRLYYWVAKESISLSAVAKYGIKDNSKICPAIN